HVGDGAAPPGTEIARAPTALTSAARFETVLRSRERTLATAGEGRRVAAATSAAVSAPRLLDTRKYPVIATLDASRFDTVTTRLRFIGNNILVWVDTSVVIADAILTPLAQWFDSELYSLDVTAFGLPSDVDGDGRVHVVLTPVVNGLTPRTQCSVSGYVAGFVSAHDLYPGTK